MRQCIPEGFHGLARQRPATGIGDGAGNHDGQLDAQPLHGAAGGECRGLGVERVENGFDQQQVGAAFDQPLNSHFVVGHQGIKIGGAITWVVDIRGQRGGAAGGADHTRDEARSGRIALRDNIAALTGQARGLDVEFANNGLQPVIGLRHGRGVEGVGFHDISASVKVGVMDLADDIRPGQRQQVVVARQVARMILETLAPEIHLFQFLCLDHGAHRAIKYQNALAEGLAKCGKGRVLSHHRFHSQDDRPVSCVSGRGHGLANFKEA